MYLDYVLFMKELMKEADIVAREMGDSKIRGVHLSRSINVLSFSVVANMQKTLRKFRG